MIKNENQPNAQQRQNRSTKCHIFTQWFNLPLHLKQLEKEEQTKPKVNRRKEIIKIRAKINEIETKKTIEKINETKSWFFEKINKIDKHLPRLIKKKKGESQNQYNQKWKRSYNQHHRNTKDHKRLLQANICQ